MRIRRAALVVALGIASQSVVAPRAEATTGSPPRGEQPAAPLIVNGSTTPISAHPHYAQVFATVDGQGTFFCGGSVVAPTIVLTAAHCVDGVDRIWVITGSDDLGRGSAIRVLRWVTNGYRPATSQNDLALLHLARRTSARPIAIVGPGSDYRWLGAGHAFEVAGMGCTFALQSTCNAGGGPSEVLMQATIPSRSDAECNNDLAIWGGIDRRSMLCAGTVSDPFGSHNAPNACFGDSGGPLTVTGPAGVPLLIGAVSWGASTCGDYPVAYTRLARFRSWLRSQGVPIERDAFDPGPPTDFDWDLVPVAGDFNGDDRTDVLWFDSAAATHRLRVASKTATFLTKPAVAFTATRAPLAGDFDGNGRDDLLIDEPGIDDDVMLLNQALGWVVGPRPRVADATEVVVGDFDGNGRDDIVRYNAGGIADELRRGSVTGALRAGPPLTVNGIYTAAIVHDHNGDGIDDILWFGANTATDALRYGTRTLEFRNGPAVVVRGDAVPIVADFSGDGRDDIAWFDPAGEDVLRESSSSPVYALGPEFVLDGALVPVAGDFDGDDVGDIMWYRPGIAAERLWLGNPT